MKWDFGTTEINKTPEKKEQAINLNYSPLGLNRTYGVLLTLIDGKDKTTTVHYETEVTCTEQLNHESYLFVINKKQIFINNKPASSINEEFAEQCAKAYYPLELLVDSNGICKGIHNLAEIKEKWQLVKKQLAQAYKNKIFTTQLEQRTLILENDRSLNRVLLEKDWFYQLFFYDTLNASQSKKCDLPVFINGNIPFTNKITYKNHPKNALKKIAQIKGVSNDPRSEYDILKGNPPTQIKTSDLKGNLDLKYQIDQKVWLDSVVGECKVDFASGKKRKVTIEIYNLKNKVPKTKSEKANALEAKKEQEEKELKGKQQKKTYSLFGKKFQLGKK